MGSGCICLAVLYSTERPAACRCCCNVSTKVLCMYLGCWVLVLSPVMSPFDVLLLLSVTSQTGHSVARLPRDAQMGAAGPVPPQPPACPPVPALCAGLSSSSSSDAASVNLELEVSACSWLFRCCFFCLGALPCCSVYVKASNPYGDTPSAGDRSRALFGQVHPKAMPRMLLRCTGCSVE